MRCSLSLGLIAILAAPLVSGCTTADERTEADRQRCATYGFTPNTEGFANCLLQQGESRANRDFIRSQVAVQQGQDMMMGTGTWAVN